MGEERLQDLAASLALVLLRYSKRLEQGRLAEAVHITQSQASDYERGKRAVPPEVLENAAAATGFPVALLDLLLRGIRSFLVAGRGRSRVDRALSRPLRGASLSSTPSGSRGSPSGCASTYLSTSATWGASRRPSRG